MKYEINMLPDDIDALKNIIAARECLLMKRDEELETEKKEHERVRFELDEYQQKYEELEKKYSQLRKYIYERKSEKLTSEDKLQGRLFNEAETDEESCITAKGAEETGDSDVTIVKQHTRNKSGRKPIPKDAPRKEIIHDLSEEEKRCPCCGETRPVIGKDESEELEYIPAQVYALRHIYPKYGPCKCEEFLNSGEAEVKNTPAIKRMLPGSIASPGLLSYIFTSKFCDALPFYRLSKMFERIDVNISRATMCNWQMSTYEKMSLFFQVFEQTLKSGEFIRMDETTVQVLHEENRSPDSKSYMWLAIGYPARDRPLVLYEYHPTRSGDVPLKFLKGFKGYLQTDGYAAYNRAVREYGLIHAGCFAHARREFHKGYDSKRKNNRAYKALMFIQRIYKIESDLRGRELDDEEFVKRRKKAAIPVLDEFHAFLIQTRDIVTPGSIVGEAVNYTLNEWEKLIRYLDRAYMTPDNNEVERSVKAFAVGRKNWLFSNTPRGANASAGMYSIIESAKMNRLDPYAYMRFLFTKLPYLQDDADEIKKLLPCFVSQDQIKSTE